MPNKRLLSPKSGSSGNHYSWKRGRIYLAVYATDVTKQINLSPLFSLSVSEEKITSDFSQQAGKIAKIQIVGTKETVQAVTLFMGEIGTATLHLMLERMVLIDRKNDVKISEGLRDKS